MNSHPLGRFSGTNVIDRMKPLEELEQKTPFRGYQGEFNFVVRSEKYSLSLYFTPDTKEHKFLKKLFSSFDMPEMKILHAPLHLPLLKLKDQVTDLTLAVSNLQSEAKETKVEIEELKRRLLILEHRDQSPKRV